MGTVDKLARRTRMGLAVTLLLLLLPSVVDPPNNKARSATKEFRRILRVGVEGSVSVVILPGVFRGEAGASLEVAPDLGPLRGEWGAWLLFRNCECALELNVPLLLFRGETGVDEAGTFGL